MNIIDKVISVISPQWAYERVAYREYLKAYEAGEVNRFNDTWMPINADTENTGVRNHHSADVRAARQHGAGQRRAGQRHRGRHKIPQPHVLRKNRPVLPLAERETGFSVGKK